VDIATASRIEHTFATHLCDEVASRLVRCAGRLPIVITIDDADDPRLDPYRSLRARESTEVLWAEGPTVVERLLGSGLTVRSLLLTPAAHTRLADRCALEHHTVFVADQRTVNAVVGFDLHRGAIAIADRPTLRPLADVLDGARRVVVLEGINDAENLGAIARSARGLGADGLVLDPTCADPYYRRSVRVSMGEMLHLPIARAPLSEVFDALDDGGFHTWALTPRRDATPIGDLVAAGVPARLAVVLGAEGPGLSDAVLGSRTNVRIPQRADVDSLNVGHATAAALAIVASSSP
jgi:tRNA G18 (ribose-2'-O)-methylase SpoU